MYSCLLIFVSRRVHAVVFYSATGAVRIITLRTGDCCAHSRTIPALIILINENAEVVSASSCITHFQIALCPTLFHSVYQPFFWPSSHFFLTSAPRASWTPRPTLYWKATKWSSSTDSPPTAPQRPISTLSEWPAHLLSPKWSGVRASAFFFFLICVNIY